MDILNKDSDNLLDSSTPDLWLVLKEQVPMVWGEVLDLLQHNPFEGALGNWEKDDLYDVLCSPDSNYWLVVGYHNDQIEAVMITHYTNLGNSITFWIESGNGNLRKYQPYLEKIERWAFSNGASEVKIRGRKALARVMDKSGYGITEYVISKPIRKLWSH